MVYFFSRSDALHSPFPFRISRRFCFCVYLFTVDVGVFFAVLSVVTWMAATCAGAWTIYSTPALTIPGSSLATTFTFSPHVGRRTYVTAFSFVHRWAQRPCWVLVISCPSSSSPPSVALSGVSLVQISSVQISVVPRKSNRGATSIMQEMFATT